MKMERERVFCRIMLINFSTWQNYCNFAAIIKIGQSKMNEWLFLLGAIAVETFATSMLGLSEQFTKPLPTIAMVVGYLLSLYLLSQALHTIPIGLAYAIWSALGIVFITFIGAVFFKQVPDVPAYIGLALIMAGVAVINLFSKMEVH